MTKRQSGFTLIELVVAMGLMTIVMSVCVSLCAVAARSLPGSADTLSQTLDARRALTRLSSELAPAAVLNKAGTDDLIAVVPDRADAKLAYTVRVVAKDSTLVRQTRDDTEVIADEIESFSIEYAEATNDATRVSSAMITVKFADAGRRPIRHVILFDAKPVLP